MNSLVNSKKGPGMVTLYNANSSAYVQNIIQSKSSAIYMMKNMVLLNYTYAGNCLMQRISKLIISLMYYLQTILELLYWPLLLIAIIEVA